MGNTMDMVHDWCGSFLHTQWFKWVVSCTILLNPFAELPQMVLALTAPNIDGVSVAMWAIFLAIQVAVMFEGIRLKSQAMFFSMFISAIESLIIIVTVLMRS